MSHQLYPEKGQSLIKIDRRALFHTKTWCYNVLLYSNALNYPLRFIELKSEIEVFQTLVAKNCAIYVNLLNKHLKEPD